MISRRRPIMPSHDRRAAGRRRAWGRGPIILKLESPRTAGDCSRQAQRQRNSTLPDLVNSSLITSTSVSDWSGNLEVDGQGQEPGRRHDHRTLSRSRSMPRPIRGINKYSVPIGQVMIPAGLAPGAVRPLSRLRSIIPSTPIPNVSSTGGLSTSTRWSIRVTRSPRAITITTKTSALRTTPTPS